MRVEGRVFRGLLDVLSLWAKTGQLIEGSNFCRLEAGEERLRVQLATEAGWLCLSVPADVSDLESPWAIDLPVLMRVLRAASWPRKGPVGEVEVVLTTTALKVNVPSWRKGGKDWVEGAPSHFSYPLGQGVCWQPEALAKAPELALGKTFVLETEMLSAAMNGASHCVASGGDRGVLRCVELICSADEVTGLATDGGVVGLASEPAGLALEGTISAPLPVAAVRAALAIWKKAGLGSEVAVSLAQGNSQPLAVLAPPGADSAFAFLLKLDRGHLPLDALQGLPATTGVEMGRTADRAALLSQLELAQLNPEAKVAWLVWDQDQLFIRSHGPLLDMSCEVPLLGVPAGAAELAIETARLRSALDQLLASGGGDGPIALAIDDLSRPTRLMLTQINAGSGQVRRVLVLAAATTGYRAFRDRVEERVAATAEAAAKERRRRRFRHQDEPDSTD